MSAFRTLSSTFQPTEITLNFPGDEIFIVTAEEELYAKARADANGCYGYFPAMGGSGNIDTDLPLSRAYAEAVPTLVVDDRTLSFNFIRLSLIQQRGDSPFHLDSDAATALTGNVSTISDRLVWRLLLNLSSKHSRTLSYLDVNPASVDLTNNGGYIHLENQELAAETAKNAVIPPRKGKKVHGVLFCASRVLHTGRDDEFGHFVAGYGREEMAG